MTAAATVMILAEDGHITDSPAAATAAQFLHALSRRDFRVLRACLAPDVWLRALLTREVVEARDAEAALDRFAAWFAGAPAFEVIETAHYPMAGRQHVRYRFRLRPEWAPGQWHLIEQAGYLKVRDDGLVGRIDLACTGYFADDAPGQ